jgi:SAM-dependent methyltransferase
MPAQRLEVPPELNRNAQRVVDAGFEETGVLVLKNVAEVLGVPDLSDVDVLDVGCGVRFTQTIVNRDVPIRSYTGVDIEPKLIGWLQKNVRDPRFRFALWEVRNEVYRKRAKPLTRDSRLPVEGTFDLICLYSVFTHLSPADADAMAHVLRPHVRPNGRMLFTAFIKDEVGTFLDQDPENPLLKAVYAEPYLTGILEKNGWRVLKSIPRRREYFVAHQILCGPA